MTLNKRMHATSSLKSSSSSSKREENYKNLIRVNLENENGVDEAVIAFRDFGLIENSRFDSKQRYISKSDLSYIYSLKENKDNVISVFPNEFSELSIPLGVKAKEGVHTISINGLNQIDPAIDVVLEDLYEGVSVNLRQSNEYSFNITAGNINDRFKLNFAQISTDLEDPLNIEDEDFEAVMIYSDNNRIMVKLNISNTDDVKEIAVYSLDGSKVLQSEFVGDSFTSESVTTNGIYLVKIIEKSKETVRKIYIH